MDRYQHLPDRYHAMIEPEDFDSDMFGFAVSVIGTAICAIGAGLWSLFA